MHKVERAFATHMSELPADTRLLLQVAALHDSEDLTEILDLRSSPRSIFTPVVVMLAILAGGELLGIPGALMAVPLVASLSVIVDEFQRERVARRATRDPD